MGPLKVVIEEKLADTETAVSAYLKLCADRADSFLLESAETHESIGRYSIIAFDPIMSLTLWPDEVVITDDAGKESRQPAEFFDLIRRTVDRMGVRPKDLPAVGSLMGYIGFDAGAADREAGSGPDRGPAHFPPGFPFPLCHFRPPAEGDDPGGPGPGRGLRPGKTGPDRTGPDRRLRPGQARRAYWK